MNNYDESIRKAQKEIEKLTAGIEKSKARITELKAVIKEQESKKANALQFSNTLIDLMNIHGIESEADKKAVLAKMDEYLQSLAADKTQQTAASAEPTADENDPTDETDEIEESDEPEDEPITPTAQNPRNDTTANYHSPSYPYRATNNGNYNS